MAENENLPAVKVNFNDWIDKLKEKVREIFTDMVPEETWGQLVQEHVDWFLTSEQGLKRVITEELEKSARAAIKNHIDSLAWDQRTGMLRSDSLEQQHNYEPHPVLVKLITAAAPAIFERIIEESVSRTLQSMSHHM